MRYVLSCVCVAFLAFPSVVQAQYVPAPPFYDSPSASNNKCTAIDNGYQPGDLEHYPWDYVTPRSGDATQNAYAVGRDYDARRLAERPPFQPLSPRDSAFVPNRAASYNAEVPGPYYQQEDTRGPLADDSSGPPIRIQSTSCAELPSSEVPSPSEPTLSDGSSPPPAATGESENSHADAAPENLDDVYIWYQPSTWFGSEWEKSIELGLKGSGGNTETISLRAGGKLERDTDSHKLLFEIVHNRAQSRGVSTQNNMLGKLRFDRKLAESRWSLFVQETGEYDEFKAFDVRLAGNLGVNYKFIATDSTTLAGDFGSGVSREFGGPDDRNVPEAALGLDFKHQLSKRQKVYFKSEYYPDWGDFHSYRVVNDTGWEVILDDAWNLNLKIGVIDRYDSTPNGRRPNDIDYSVLLLWKL